MKMKEQLIEEVKLYLKRLTEEQLETVLRVVRTWTNKK